MQEFAAERKLSGPLIGAYVYGIDLDLCAVMCRWPGDIDYSRWPQRSPRYPANALLLTWHRGNRDLDAYVDAIRILREIYHG
jgi:hypothetical protein